MKKSIQELTAKEYLEEIRRVRSNPPEVTYEESRRQYLELMENREQIAPPAKVVRSGAGRRKTAAA